MKARRTTRARRGCRGRTICEPLRLFTMTTIFFVGTHDGTASAAASSEPFSLLGEHPRTSLRNHIVDAPPERG